jgi:hypothetical protein
MKQFIVLCSTVILGIMIYNMVAGPGSDSVMSTVSEVWQQGIQIRTDSP